MVPCVQVPVPDNTAPAVADMVIPPVLSLVTVTPVTITLFAKESAVVPEMDCGPEVLKVAPPATKEVPLLVIPPRKTTLAEVVTTEVSKVPPKLTLPAKMSMPLLLESVKPPVPVVVPDMVRLFVLE